MARTARVVREGFLLLDKPTGWTSNRCLQEVKRRLNAAKGGHTGSLDPLATGLLPLCFGHATRLSQFLLEADKTYEAVFRLGIETDTLDADGAVVAIRPVVVDGSALAGAVARLRGPIQQIPPMYSAIKMGGSPLYKRARAGEEIERVARTVRIERFEVLEYAGDEVRVLVACSKGTYIRSLAQDLGALLGCGAHVQALRRTAVGGFTLDAAVTVEAVVQACVAGHAEDLLVPADRVLQHLPAAELDARDTDRVQRGQGVPLVGSHWVEGWVRMYGGGAAFLGIGWWANGVLHPKRVWNSVGVG